MVGADAGCGSFQGRAFRAWHGVASSPNLGGRKRQCLGRQVQLIKPSRQLNHSRITARAHIRDDARDRVIHVGRIFTFRRQSRRETVLEVQCV